MTAGQDAALAALKESVRENRLEVKLAGETVDLLRDEIRQSTALAVAEAMRTVMADKALAQQFFRTGVEVLREQAAAQTGKFVLDGLSGLARKVLVTVIVLASLWVFIGTAGMVSIGTAVYRAVIKT